MAFARVIVEDQSSATFDEIRKTVNTIIFMLEAAGTSVTAGATAEQILSAWSAGIAVGVDSNPAATANIVPTNREIVCTKPNIRYPNRPGLAGTNNLVPVVPTDSI